MGMYDELRCDYPLPSHAEMQGHVNWQTKDLESALDQYVITRDGWFVLEKSPWRDLPTPQPIDYSGELVFYSFDSSNHWVQFVAHFTNGKLGSLVEVIDREEVAEWTKTN